MRYPILVILITLFKLATFGQQTTNNDTLLRGIDLFKLGDSITKFKGLIDRADGKSDPFNLDDSLTCWAFRYKAAAKDSVIIGDVKFNDVLLLPNKQKLVIIVSFYKHYLKSKTADPKKAVTDDFKSLIRYVSKHLKQKAKRYEFPSLGNDPNEQSKIWTKKNIEFFLKKIKINAPKADLKYRLEFTYEFKGVTQF